MIELLERLEGKGQVVESDVWVDVNGYAHDDEGNVWRVGQHNAGHYGRRGSLPTGGARSTYNHGNNRSSVNADQTNAIAKALGKRHNNFLDSVGKQLVAGRTLSMKQKSIVVDILLKMGMASEADLFR